MVHCNNKLTAKEVQRILTTDGRTKLFKEKLKKLGYVKDAKQVSKVMEKTADFAMMSDGGNKKVIVQLQNLSQRKNSDRN